MLEIAVIRTPLSEIVDTWFESTSAGPIFKVYS